MNFIAFFFPFFGLKKILIKAPYPMTEDVECNEMHEVREEGEIKDKENSLNWKQRHQLKHRELFLSRQVETLPATHIRGKCSVTLLNETESVLSYLNKDVRILLYIYSLIL